MDFCQLIYRVVKHEVEVSDLSDTAEARLTRDCWITSVLLQPYLMLSGSRQTANIAPSLFRYIPSSRPTLPYQLVIIEFFLRAIGERTY